MSSVRAGLALGHCNDEFRQVMLELSLGHMTAPLMLPQLPIFMAFGGTARVGWSGIK